MCTFVEMPFFFKAITCNIRCVETVLILINIPPILDWPKNVLISLVYRTVRYRYVRYRYFFNLQFGKTFILLSELS